MSEFWRDLHSFGHGTCLGYDHELRDPVTESMTKTILQHAMDVKAASGLRDYHILEVGASPQPTLSSVIALTFRHMRPDLAARAPKVSVTALDVVPAHADEKALREIGVNYVVGDVNKLPYKKPQFHATIMSTVLEYLDDKVKALSNVREAMHPNGMLLMLLHAPGSNTAAFLRETAAQEEKAFGAMNSFRKRELSAQNVMTSLKDGHLYRMFGFGSPHEMLDDFLKNPDRHEVVSKMIEAGVFDKHRQLADQIERGSFKNPEELKGILDKAGFDLANVAEFRGWDGGQKFWLASARRR